jgi:hypothetical protein
MPEQIPRRMEKYGPPFLAYTAKSSPKNSKKTKKYVSNWTDDSRGVDSYLCSYLY